MSLRELLLAEQGDWTPLLRGFANSPAGRALCTAVDGREARGAVVYPPAPVRLRALALTPLAATRVLILGQDPYHGPGQAEGLAFSVPPGQALPPSLRNILTEWRRDLGRLAPSSGSLVPWAEQGVLMLNTSLTVEAGQPGSHAALGWRALTDAIVSILVNDERPKVFMLWGAHAQGQSARVVAAGGLHLLLECNHPSPLAARRGARPFVGCGHFGQASRWLAQSGLDELRWTLG